MRDGKVAECAPILRRDVSRWFRNAVWIGEVDNVLSSVFPLSFSRMSVFEQCALRFDHQYVSCTHKDAGSDASRYGNRIHTAFERYCKFDEPLPAEAAQWQVFLDRLRNMPGQHEYELEMAVRADQSECGWDDADCHIRGIADVAVINGTKGFAGDYKTGKPKDDTQQLKLMALMMFLRYSILDSVSTTYFWLLYPKAPTEVIKYTRDMIPDMWAHFQKKVVRIEEAVQLGVFKPTPSGLCPWCPVYDTCAYAKRRKR